MKTSKRPMPYIWTPESITSFWNLVEQTPLIKSSFGKLLGKEALALIKRYVSLDSHILDFGAGSGDIALLLLEEGYSVSVYEPSPERGGAIHALNLERFPRFGGFFSPHENECSLKQFDALLCFEVLEHIHLDIFDATMRTIGDLCRGGGVLLGTVPACEDLDYQYCICPNCSTMFHRWQHMRSFTEESLRSLLIELHWEEIKIFCADFCPSFVFSGIKPIKYC